jgi:hypothetical protein
VARSLYPRSRRRTSRSREYALFHAACTAHLDVTHTHAHFHARRFHAARRARRAAEHSSMAGKARAGAGARADRALSPGYLAGHPEAL